MINNILKREKVADVKRQFVKITNCCNNNCLFCLDSDAHDNSFTPKEKVKKLLKQGRANNATKVIISGGEASINSDFIKYIKYAQELGYKKIQTITNGRMYSYERFLREAVKAGLNEITFSIHGHNSQLHDKLTNVPGAFVQIIKALENTKKYPDLIINIDVVLNKLNLRHLYDIINYFSKEYNIYEYDLLQIVPFGAAYENRKELFYDLNDENLQELKRIFKLAKNDKRFFIWTNRFPIQFLEDYEFLIQAPGKIYDEMKGRRDMFEEFLYKNIPLSCKKNTRCSVCFLNDFCSRLVNFKTNIKSKPKYKIIDSVENIKKIQKGVKYIFELDNVNYKEVLSEKSLAKRKDVFLTLKNFPSLADQIDKGLDLKEFEKLFSKAKYNFVNIPQCLLAKNQDSKYDFNSYLPFILEKGQISLDKYIDIYIEKLYFVKSLRCEKCRHHSSCNGLHINKIRQNSFNILKPIK